MSSVAATLSLPRRVAYGSAKSALEGFTRSLAAEWAPYGIRVNAVAPGTITTPLVAENFDKGLLDRQKVIERTPLGRLGSPGRGSDGGPVPHLGGLVLRHGADPARGWRLVDLGRLVGRTSRRVPIRQPRRLGGLGKTGGSGS